MTFRFEKLSVWREAREMVKEIYLETQKFPNEEKFALIDQLRRASISVVLNISEGSERKSDKDFNRFLIMANSSIHEVVAALYIAKDLGYIDSILFDKLYNDANKLASKITSLKNKLAK